MRLRQAYSQIYIHIIWATWDRLPLLSPDLKSAVYACIQSECVGFKAEVMALGGVEDHVHLLVRIPPSAAVSSLVQHIKGVSSHLVTHELMHDEGFKWQGAYSAFSVSPSDVPRVRDYILNQERHHRDGSLDNVFELPAEALG